MASIINATTSSGLVTSADNSGSLQLATNNGTTAVTIDTSQNVGIGLTPPVGSGNYRSLNVGATFIYGNTGLAVAAYNNNADINDKYIITGFASSYTQSSGNHIWYNAASGSAGASISFTERMRITSTGVMYLGPLATNFSFTNGSAVDISGSGTGIAGTGTNLNLGVWNGPMVFQAGNSGGALVERMRITSGGALCVGTTSATGSVRFIVESDTTTLNPMSVSNSRATASTDYSIIFYRAGNIVGSVQTSLSATSFVTSSDYRLKENIVPMTGALAKVAQLNPVTYDWKAGGSSQGFIAHELQAVVPNCVTGEKDEVDADGNIKPQGVDTSFLVATLTAAIQELKAELDATKAEVQALKGVS